MARSASKRNPVGRGTEARRPRRRWLRRLLIGMAVLLAVVLGAGAWAVHAWGPMFGIYLIAPSPKRYAKIALGFLDQGYYAEGAEWETARTRVEEAAAGAESYADLHAVLADATKVAGGKHSFFLTPEESAQNSEVAQAEYLAPEVSTAGGVTTIVVPEVGSDDQAQLQDYATVAAKAIADAAPQTCGWIVDLRGNRGGNMYPMFSGLTQLLPDGPAMTFRTRDGVETEVTMNPDGVAVGGGATVHAVPEQSKVQGQPIAVLLDQDTASSGEAVATAFHGLDRVRSFGVPTAGYTSANSVLPLYDKALLVLTGAVYVDRDGVNLNEEPIVPDVEASPTTVLDEATGWLAEQGCSG
ncbi:S41 family peptidase [Tessaracoccus caeni]|uniref:S41 family peptidase n=1 Tax=Tessaracoccus caeni TaxID=3031239 RepID=UPI0023DB424C|nr:S41 family peptidase [Tessaracoccus caeni]MDF1488646.1 S41 family peptidase [Tessaracoccus caeni]